MQKVKSYKFKCGHDAKMDAHTLKCYGNPKTHLCPPCESKVATGFVKSLPRKQKIQSQTFDQPHFYTKGCGELDAREQCNLTTPVRQRTPVLVRDWEKALRDAEELCKCVIDLRDDPHNKWLLREAVQRCADITLSLHGLVCSEPRYVFTR